MSSDIKLEETFVVVEGNALKVSGSDIMLDGGNNRRGSAGGDHRRALVHDNGDRLTINYANDYSGGVLIKGRVEIEGISFKLNLPHDSNLFIGETSVGSQAFTAKGFDYIGFVKHVPGALGPVLTLTNTAGVKGAGAAIDFNGYAVGSNPPTARIQSFDDGNCSSYISFYTKEPGDIKNSLKEVLRINNDGNICILGNIIINRVLGSNTTILPTPIPIPLDFYCKTIDLMKMAIDLESCQKAISKLENEVDNLKKEVAILKNR